MLLQVSAVNPEVDASLSRYGDSQGIRRIVSALQVILSAIQQTICGQSRVCVSACVGHAGQGPTIFDCPQICTHAELCLHICSALVYHEPPAALMCHECTGVMMAQAHTWPGLRMKPHSGALSSGFSLAEGAGDLSRPKQPASLAQFHSSAAATLEHSPRDSFASAAARQHQPNGAQASTLQETGSERGGESDSAHAREHHSAAANIQTAHSSGNTMESSQGVNLETSDSEGEEGGGLEEFESMLRRLQQGRSQLQGLPDDERRARAASMAAEMIQVLGIHEEDSDSDSPA